MVVTRLSSAIARLAFWGLVALGSDLLPVMGFLIPGPTYEFFSASESLPSFLPLLASAVPLHVSSVGHLLGEAPPDLLTACDLAHSHLSNPTAFHSSPCLPGPQRYWAPSISPTSDFAHAVPSTWTSLLLLSWLAPPIL